MDRLVKLIALVLLVIALSVVGWLLRSRGLGVYETETSSDDSPEDCSDSVRLAVIGDYGNNSQAESDVATLVESWSVDFVVTVGDNNYPDGEASTIDDNVGQYYSAFIYPYNGEHGPGAIENNFFPAPGNHDWRTDSLEPYLDFFTLPGNERYYDLERGPLHLFVLDSDPDEPDGHTSDSFQASWLQNRLSSSTAPWKLVFLHHAPYSSSSNHGSDAEMQWPFAQWGATGVLGGHDHTYERLQVDSIPYFVNGLGGAGIYRMGTPVDGSLVRYNRDHGAMLITAGESCINFSFYSRDNELIDSHTIEDNS